MKNEEQQQELTTAQEPSVRSGIRLSHQRKKMNLGSHLLIQVPTKLLSHQVQSCQRVSASQSERHFTLLKSPTESLSPAVTAPAPHHSLVLVSCSHLGSGKKMWISMRRITLGLQRLSHKKNSLCPKDQSFVLLARLIHVQKKSLKTTTTTKNCNKKIKLS